MSLRPLSLMWGLDLIAILLFYCQLRYCHYKSLFAFENTYMDVKIIIILIIKLEQLLYHCLLVTTVHLDAFNFAIFANRIN